LHPPLTSVRQPIAEVGQRLVALLLGQMGAEPATPAGVMLAPELVIRRSSQP